MKFTEEGTFRIAQLTDIHLKQNPLNENDRAILRDIEKGLNELKPDLIVVTGDMVDTYENPDALTLFKTFFEFLNRFDVPKAVTYGNHDSESGITRDEIEKLFKTTVEKQAERKHEYVVSQRSNYTIEIDRAAGEKAQRVLYFIDTGEYSPDHKKEYDWVLPQQVQWFKETAKQYPNTDDNLVFIHLPLQEYLAAKDKILSGEVREPGGLISVGRINTGLFSELYFSKQIYGVFCGHNHLNNAEFLYEGIHLFYGMFSGKEPKAGDFRGIRYIDYLKQGAEVKSGVLFYKDME